jgi:hypothetical protein
VWSWVSKSIGLSIPLELCSRRRLWKISTLSKIALASSTRVRQLRPFWDSVCVVPQNNAILGLSKQSPTVPIDGKSSERRARAVKAHELN